MRLTLIFLIAVHAASAQGIPLERRGPYVVVGGVFVNGRGPFRFLLDTGAQSCAISPALAGWLGLAPKWRLDLATVTGSRTLGGTSVERMSVGSTAVHDVETVLGGMDAVLEVDRGIDGILGQSFLRGLDYLLDYRRSELRLNVAPELVAGERVPFKRSHSRLIVQTSIDGVPRWLVLDSGAPAVVLFSAIRRGRRSALLRTNAGRSPASVGIRRVRIGTRERLLAVAEIAGAGESAHGLFPLSALGSIYVNSKDQYVVIP